MERYLHVYDLRKRLEQLQRALKNEGQIEEMNNLLKLKADLGLAWQDNVSLINEDDFILYAQVKAEDMHGNMDQWPFDHIDWDDAARSLKVDYRMVEFDDEIWWYRL